MLCPFSTGLDLAPKGIFEMGPSRNQAPLPRVPQLCMGDVRVGIKKHLGMLGVEHHPDTLPRGSGDQAEGEPSHLCGRPGAWMVAGPVLPGWMSTRFREELLAVGQVAVGGGLWKVQP